MGKRKKKKKWMNGNVRAVWLHFPFLQRKSHDGALKYAISKAP
jgi:protein-disulfide isomerase